MDLVVWWIRDGKTKTLNVTYSMQVPILLDSFHLLKTVLESVFIIYVYSCEIVVDTILV